MDLKKNKIISKVGDELEKVFDPEMPSVSVIKLGLIYDITVSDDDVVNMVLVIPRYPGFGTDSAGSGVTRGQSDTESARARLHLAAMVPWSRAVLTLAQCPR